MKPRLLIVDDDESILESLRERFAARGFEVSTATSGAGALKAARARPDLMLLDLQLPQGDGQSVLEALRERAIDTTVIVITAHGNFERAVAAMRAGAYDFVEKPFDAQLLEESLRRGLERSRLARDVAALRSHQPERSIIGSSEALQTVLRTASKAATSDASLLLLGESGTGKELLARFVHEQSPRREGPFVAIHCAALSESLLESELFGHEKGAFTGATSRKKGRLEVAHGGTLFLDEIAELPENFQVKLLRVLQERRFERVGGTEEIEVDVRILAATHRDLRTRIAEGAFREDLFYRLNVISLHLPALRERRADIEELCEHFARALATEAGRETPGFAPQAMAALRAHAWPGNIRELRNAIERALVLGDGSSLTLEDLPSEIQTVDVGEEPSGFHELVDRERKRILETALQASSGNRSEAARSLGLQRTYLARLLKKYGIE